MILDKNVELKYFSLEAATAEHSNSCSYKSETYEGHKGSRSKRDGGA